MVDTPQGWTEEELDIVRKGIALGLSAAQISKEMLPGRSRNSIIGKVHRSPELFPAKLALALSPAEKEYRRGLKTGTAKKVEKRMPRAKANPILRDIPLPAPIRFRRAHTPPMAGDFKGLELWELERGQCRFPQGDGPFTFCAQNVEKGGSYCADHAAICYRTVEERAAA